MLFACDLTVSGAILNWRAILLLDNPSPMRRTIMRSRIERETPACFPISSENTVKLCSVEVSINSPHAVIAVQPTLHEQFSEALARTPYDLSTSFCHLTQLRPSARTLS